MASLKQRTNLESTMPFHKTMKHHISRVAQLLSLALFAASAIALGPARAATLDLDAPAAEREQKLIALIKSDAQPADKALALKQLAICGSADAVPALAGFLGSEEFSTWARIALEVIPGPAPDEALRAALTTVQGRPLIGVISSIGVRRDPKAAYPLITKLRHPDAQVVSAAAIALGHIGGDSAARGLEIALAETSGATRSTVAEGCILCAERWLAEGQAAKAMALYDTVRKADVPQQRVAEATRGAILARGSDGTALLLEQLRSPDKAIYSVGLRAARELPGTQVTDALASAVKQLAPDRQWRVLLALADRRDAAVLPAVKAFAKDGPAELRVTALNVLEHIGDTSCIPLLIDAATLDDRAVAQAAKASLASLHTGNVDAELLRLLPQAAGKQRQVLVETASARRIESAVPSVLRYATDADAGLRKAAFDALAALGGPKEMGAVVDLLKSATPQDRDALEQALLAISGRSGAASAPTLMPLAGHNDPSLRAVGLHALAAVGGPEALAAVRKAVDDQEPSVQDDAVRTLSTWPNNWPDDNGVAEPLLALAKSGRKPMHQALGLRGYLQYLQGTKHLGNDEKLAKVSEAMPLMKSPDQKQLAAAVLGAIPVPGAIDMLVGFAGDADTAEAACSALTALAVKNAPEFTKDQRRKALQTVLDKSKNDGTRKRADEALKKIQ